MVLNILMDAGLEGSLQLKTMRCPDWKRKGSVVVEVQRVKDIPMTTYTDIRTGASISIVSHPFDS